MGRAASLETTGVGAAAREEEQEQVCFQTGSRLSLKKSLQSASGWGKLVTQLDDLSLLHTGTSALIQRTQKYSAVLY